MKDIFGGDLLYGVGEYIIYGTSGVCRIEKITNQPFGKTEPKQYYVLKPMMSNVGSAVYTPVDTEIKIRRLMTESDIRELRESIVRILPVEIPTEKKRRDVYRDTVISNNPADWVRILRTVAERRRRFAVMKKRLPEVDTEFETIAKKCLCCEIAIVLGTTYEIVAAQTDRYISECLA